MALFAGLLMIATLASARGQGVPTTNITTTVTTTTSTTTAAAGVTNTITKTNITTTTSTLPARIPWDTSASAGLTLTRGNSKTLLITLGLDTKRKWEQNEAGFGLTAGYGTENNVDNNKYVNGFGQYNRMFSDRFYGGLRLDASYDGIAQLDYRVTLSPLAGYYAIKDPNTTLCFEAGPSAVAEKHEGEAETTYLGFRFAERFDHKLSATTRVWESLSYVPRVDEWMDKYVITAEAGIDAAVNKHWSLRVVLQDMYDSEPTAGRENNDIRLVAGTSYKF